MNGCTWKDFIFNNLHITTNLKIPKFNFLDLTENNPGLRGDLAFNRADNTFYGHDGAQWIPLSGNFGPSTLSSAGGDETLVVNGVGPNLVIKGLTAGAGIVLTGDLDDIVISATGGEVTTLESAGGDTSLVNDGVGPVLAIKGLTPGDGISFSGDATEVIISATGGDVTLASIGLGEDLVVNGTAPALTIKGLVAGEGIALSSTATDIIIDSTMTETTLTSIGLGENLVDDGVGPDLTIKGLAAGDGVSLSTNDTDIIISATGTGENVTLSSVGGTSLVNDGAGPDLAIKGLIAGDGITILDEPTNLTISAPGNNVTLNPVGTGESIVFDGLGPSLVVKTLAEGTGISIASGPTDLTISATGDNVSLTSAGGTETLVNDGVGPALATKGLTAGTGVSLSSNATAVTIGITPSVTIVNQVLTSSNSLAPSWQYQSFTFLGNIFGNGVATTLSFNSLGSLPFGILKVICVGAAVGGSGTLLVYFNNDVGNNYAVELTEAFGNGPTANAKNPVSTNAIYVGELATAAFYAGCFEITFPNWSNTSFYKATYSTGGRSHNAVATSFGSTCAGIWLNTATITTITFSCGSAFANGTKFSLFGI